MNNALPAASTTMSNGSSRPPKSGARPIKSLARPIKSFARQRHRAARAASVASLILLAATSWGCASTANRGAGLDLAMRQAGIAPGSIVIPFGVTDEMRGWALAVVPTGASPRTKVDALLSRLLASDELDLQYSGAYTGTAQEVWETHEANCVGFTHLFVGLARAVGLNVKFLKVDDITTYNRDGDLVVVAGHMAVGYGDGADMRVLDFSPTPVRKYRAITAIADHTAVAMYYSNKGAEELRAGRNPTAIEALELATRLDPQLADAWVNLGVAYRRSKQPERAETTYRQALELEPDSPSAYQNLAVLYRLRGKDDVAEELLRLAARFANRNPFTFLVLGDWSLANRQFSDAEKFYRNALRVGRDHADAPAAMGMWEVAAGDPARAHEWLEKARRIDPANERVIALERELTLRPEQRSSL